ncbi:PaaI family thioesterase [Rhizobium leguminosarum]
MLKHVLPLIHTVMPSMVHGMIMARMSEIIPFNKLLGIELQAVEDGLGRAFLPHRDDLLNHIGTVHATAIYGLAEAASGCAMSGALAPMIATIRPVAASAKIDYLKAAKTALTAIGRTVEAPSTLREMLKRDRKARFNVQVDVADANHEQVASIVVEWHVSLKA